MVEARTNQTAMKADDVSKIIFRTLLPSELIAQVLTWTVGVLTLVALIINGCTLVGLRYSEDFSCSPRFALLRSLILSDILLITTQGPTIIYCLYQKSTMHVGVWCLTQYVINQICVYGSLVTITCMALERYLYVCHAIHYIGILTPPRMCIVVLGTWVLASCVSAVYMTLLHAGQDQRIHLGGYITFGLVCEPDTLENSVGNPRPAAIFRKSAGFVVTVACLLSYAFSYTRMYQVARNAVQPFLQVNRRARNTVLFHCGMLQLQLLPIFLKIASDALWEVEGGVTMKPGNNSSIPTPSPTAGLLHIVLLILLLVPPCINPLIFGLRNHEVYQALGRVLWCDGKCVITR